MFVGKQRSLKSRSMKVRIQKVVEFLEQLSDCQLLKEELHQKEIKTVSKPSFTVEERIIQCYPQMSIEKRTFIHYNMYLVKK